MENKINEVKELYRKSLKVSDWQERGEIIKQGFKVSVDIVKTVVPQERHYIVDQVVEALLNNRGLGWFCDNREGLMIRVIDKKEIAKYAANWVTKAKETGLQI
jgi:hypothetical protein